MTWTYKTALGAMAAGTLLPDFNGWHLAYDNGWSVAHDAALHGLLPAGFTQWDIANKRGWTVARAAAERGHLPDDLPAHIWRLKDGVGESVWDVAKERGLVTGDPPPLPMPTIKPGDFSPVPPLF